MCLVHSSSPEGVRIEIPFAELIIVSHSEQQCSQLSADVAHKAGFSSVEALVCSLGEPVIECVSDPNTFACTLEKHMFFGIFHIHF